MNARVIHVAVQSLENLHTFILRQQIIVGGQKNTHQLISSHNIIENSPTSLTHNSVSDRPNELRFGTETCYMVLQAILKFEGD